MIRSLAQHEEAEVDHDDKIVGRADIIIIYKNIFIWINRLD